MLIFDRAGNAKHLMSQIFYLTSEKQAYIEKSGVGC